MREKPRSQKRDLGHPLNFRKDAALFSSPLLVAQQDYRINRQGPTGRRVSSQQSQQEHCQNHSDEHRGIAGSRLIHNVGKHPGCRHAQQQTCNCACRQEPERSSQRCLQHFFTLRSQGHTDAEFAQPLAHRIRGHAKNAGNGEHRPKHAQHTQRDGCHARSK